MLWQKESENSDALYVDISKVNEEPANDLMYLAKQMILTTNEKSLPAKNNAESLKKRQEGNEMLVNHKLEEAIERFNESLCYAETGSENISLAYANRSAVFFRMNQFDRCLKDIELAKKAGYPDHMRPKLDQREVDCLKCIDDGAQCENISAKLSFKPNEHFPSLANVLQVEKDANGKCKVIALEDIDVGQTIMLENSFISYLFNRFASKCNICLRAHVNLMPCDKCTKAMFCSAECQSSPLHTYECGIKLCDNELMNCVVMKDLRVLFQAVNLFQSADDLMDFVDETRKSGPDDLPLTLADEHSRYRAFLKQSLNTVSANDLALSTHLIYNNAMKISSISNMFHTLNHKRFLMHLIAFHILMKFERRDDAQIGLITKYFNESSTPNMLSVRGNGKQAGIVIRPIKKGDEILNSCAPINNQQQFLASATQQNQIEQDSDFGYITNNFLFTAQTNPQKIIDKCIAVLKKYGDIGYCEQIAAVILIYGRFTSYCLES